MQCYVPWLQTHSSRSKPIMLGRVGWTAARVEGIQVSRATGRELSSGLG